MTSVKHRLRSSPRSDESDDEASGKPLRVFEKDFWDEHVAHVALQSGEVCVVLEDAIKLFSGTSDPSTVARDTRKHIESVKKGAF